jgi:hypothetical protein
MIVQPIMPRVMQLIVPPVMAPAGEESRPGRRRLAAEGAAWGPLKDEVRRDLALQLLAEGRLSGGDIAARAGAARRGLDRLSRT